MGYGSVIRLAAGLAMVMAAAAQADYYSHPKLRPEWRCQDIPAGIGSPDDPGGVNSFHCQRLFWDLPAVTEVGTIVVAAPFEEDPVPRFPRGLTDRVPPMFVGTKDGQPEGFEHLEDCNVNAAGCQRLCDTDLPDATIPEDQVPYWQELLNTDGSAKIGTDGFDNHAVGSNGTAPQEGPLFQLACQRGTRTYYGPWQTGDKVAPENCDPATAQCGNVYDRLASNQFTKFESTARLDRDVEALRTTPDRRLEWNTGSEFYNHFASHHGTCWASGDPCADAANPKPREAYNTPDGECAYYEYWTTPGTGCHPEDADNACHGAKEGEPQRPAGSNGSFRNATQIPGRLSVPLPGNRGVETTEDTVWMCNHHVVTQLPPGSYDMDRLANYRLQQRGVVNDTTEYDVYGVPPGEEVGGAVGEMIIQYFTRPMSGDVKPLNIAFNAAADLATTWYPPFTWNYHESEWLPPFDAAVGLTAIHSHHRMVKGTMAVAPASPPRTNSQDPNCGGAGSTDIYTSWYWEDAPVCQYWKETDGPVIVRKGQSLRTTCYVNNGVTPEAIKHGLVAGSAVQTLKVLGAPIPDYPELMPASTWGDALAESPVGRQLLYGLHPPINYRVVYKCSTQAPTLPGATIVPLDYEICSPNPAVDADLDYIDGPYKNPAQCGGDPDALCQPGTIRFACIGEDEMCIGVSMYWALPRLGGEGNDEAMENLQSGNVNEVGTPGNAGADTSLSGLCPECDQGPGL